MPADARVLGVPTSHPTLKFMVMCMHVCVRGIGVIVGTPPRGMRSLIQSVKDTICVMVPAT